MKISEIKLAKSQKGKNDNSKEAEAHGLGPNPRAQLSGTKSVKWSLSAHFRKRIALLHF